MIQKSNILVKTGILLFLVLSNSLLYSKNYTHSEIKKGDIFRIAEFGSVYLPKSYSDNKKYPLMVVLHPLGSNDGQFIRKFIGDAENREMILIAPRARNIYWDGDRRSPDTKNVMRMIFEIKRKFSVDNKKVLLYGFSSGGSFTHQIVTVNKDNHGEKCITAYCAVSGGAGFNFEYKYIRKNRMPDRLKIPAYIIWGSKEEPNPPGKDVYDFLSEKGWDVTVKVHDGGHYIPDGSISEVLDWFQNKCKD
jgi:predicted esterase